MPELEIIGAPQSTYVRTTRMALEEKGVPYTLYPIYGVHGASLYFIGSSSNSVKLAVRTSGRY